MSNLSLILPAYNEEDNTRETVSRSVEVLKGLFDDFEIIILNDASRDRTGEIADELAAEHPQIRVIHNKVNVGQGINQIRGFKEARFELVTHNGMDAPFDLSDVSKMLPLLDEADVVVAGRTDRPGYTIYRKSISAVNKMMLRLLFGLRLTDCNFVQLYKKSVLDSIKVDADSTGFVVPEILIRAHDMGYKIKEIPIEYHARKSGEATSGNPRIVYKSLKDMLNFWWKRRRQPH